MTKQEAWAQAYTEELTYQRRLTGSSEKHRQEAKVSADFVIANMPVESDHLYKRNCDLAMKNEALQSSLAQKVFMITEMKRAVSQYVASMDSEMDIVKNWGAFIASWNKIISLEEK